MQNSKLNKLRTVLAVLMMLMTIFSFVYIASEAKHHCTGENCPICFVIQVIKTNFGGLILVFVASRILRHFAESKKIAFSSIKIAYISNTLFLLKTRLND